MTPQFAIIDTNVVVAGLLTKHATSPVARILDGMLVGAFAFALSEPLIAEYRNVLVRPPLRKQHGLSVTEVEMLLTDLVQLAILVEPQPAEAAPDPGDQMLWELLAARPDLILVTGDKLLLQHPGMAGRIATPLVFCSGWSAA